ncbi:biotin transporter BioY [Erysipelothrix inopinata]|uniref:Biotin transporter n=1 Tax=Erysipelothrix inopinata TaxID=225084 RepID=A0A7G9RWL0_9FIRM|nr:biotin transporter BioY [Erysipelothrix inopinata]QNN59985.1 biotin transporter BioY [Erysipelothrix inopinata]
MKAKDLSLAALFACFIAISAFIKIPLPVIPFTLQVFAICLTALTLTFQQTFFAILIYILLGLIGLPVFAGGMSGIQVFMSPTFGFILGFIPMALTLNTLYNRLPKKQKWLAFIASEIVLYAIALPILYFNVKMNSGVSIPLSKLFVAYWFTFIPTDTISMLLSVWVKERFLSGIKR